MALNREKILDTALDLLCRFGLADLSMRRLASELGVAPGALYYHVANKQELLSSLANRLLAHLDTSRSLQGPSDLLRQGQALYQLLIPVKESAEVLRLALAYRGLKEQVFPLRQQLTLAFARLAPAGQEELAAEVFLHTCLSLMEQTQTQALLAGQLPADQPDSSYQQALSAIIKGFTDPDKG